MQYSSLGSFQNLYFTLLQLETHIWEQLIMAELVELAPGFSCYSGSTDEAKFIYKEIYEEHCYDIAVLPEDAFILDVGANVGLFSIYMKQKYPSSTILAFECAPVTLGHLKSNLALHGVTSGIEVYPNALGSSVRTETFTYYPHLPGNSTFVPEEKERVLRPAIIKAYNKELADYIMEAQTMTIEMRPISNFLRYHPNLNRIDLLKIDVESAELDVLQGLDESHWNMVCNIAVEVCDLDGLFDRVVKLIESKGFVTQSSIGDVNPAVLEQANIYLIEAHRLDGK